MWRGESRLARTKIVALQAGPFGIRANCIAPKTILTEGNQPRIPSETQSKRRPCMPPGGSASPPTWPPRLRCAEIA
jgi:NAD(P)-dependent dehydrogenase (short-subunit alcohol dehydrogenase family)